MNHAKMKIIKFDTSKGPTYDCGKVRFLKRKKGAICADHVHNIQEIFYLLNGQAKFTIGTETKTITAPSKIIVQPNEYHKFIALTDLDIIEDREEN